MVSMIVVRFFKNVFRFGFKYGFRFSIPWSITSTMEEILGFHFFRVTIIKYIPDYFRKVIIRYLAGKDTVCLNTNTNMKGNKFFTPKTGKVLMVSDITFK